MSVEKLLTIKYILINKYIYHILSSLLLICLTVIEAPPLYSDSGMNKKIIQSSKYEHLSADNPVFELFKGELNGDTERIERALNIVNNIVGRTKDKVQNTGNTKETQPNPQQLDLLYNVLQNELMAVFPEKGVELVTEGLLVSPPLIDCDTSCALYLIVSYELKWPLSIMSCINNGNDDKSHAFLKWTNGDGCIWYYETTNGITMEDYKDIPIYGQSYKIITEITTGQFFANFSLIAADQKSYDNNLLGRIKLYTKAIEQRATLLPRSSQFYNRGNTYLSMGEYIEAIRDYTSSLNEGPPSSRMYYNRSIAYLYMENRLKSLQDLIMAIKLDPEHKDARYNRSVVYFQEKHYAMALSDALWLYKKYPDDKDFEKLYIEIKRISNEK